jgi:hypothetical protein
VKRGGWRERAARQAIRAREKAELARLRLELGAAKERRTRLLREARALCKRGRLALRARLAAEREALKLKGQQARKAERAACRARKAVAKRSGAGPVAAVKAAIIAERRAHATQRLQAGELAKKAQTSSAESRSESDDAVLRDIPAELVKVWKKVRKNFQRGSAHQRAERFLEWAEENGGEVLALQEADADREIARLVREQRAMVKQSRMRKTKADIARELEAVPF